MYTYQNIVFIHNIYYTVFLNDIYAIYAVFITII